MLLTHTDHSRDGRCGSCRGTGQIAAGIVLDLDERAEDSPGELKPEIAPAS